MDELNNTIDKVTEAGVDHKTMPIAAQMPIENVPESVTEKADRIKARLLRRKSRELLRVECGHNNGVVLFCDTVITREEIESFSKPPRGSKTADPVVVMSKVIARAVVDIEIDGELIGYGFATEAGMAMFDATSAAGAVRVFYSPGDDDAALVTDGTKIVNASGWGAEG
jgi:hypothetical protein